MRSAPDLHIVTFNVPWPANYGGVIDSFYRIDALARMGLNIELHCFTKDRGAAAPLHQLCRNVHYYKRRVPFVGLLGSEPYIVSSRTSIQLHNRLISDNAPILFDGLHTTWYLQDQQLENRRKVVRMHNVEWEYYAGLAKIERRMLREFYFQIEARRLKKYERILQHAHAVACISHADTAYYAKQLGEKAAYVPAFHPYEQVVFPGETAVLTNGAASEDGSFALYHGNLSVGENVQAATWLIHNVFANLKTPLVIAGMDPDYKLHDLVNKYEHITLVSDPDDAQMESLVHDAHLHVLPTFQPTGIKLKLLRALFAGRFVLANREMVEDTGLEPWVIVRDSPSEWISEIKELMQRPYDVEAHHKREGLAEHWSNRRGAEQLLRLLYEQ